MKKVLAIVALMAFGLALSGGMVFAAQKAATPAAKTAAAAPAAAKKTMAGVLEEKDGAMVLKAESGVITLSGNVAKELLGKKVTVTGVEGKAADGKITMKVEKVDLNAVPAAKPAKLAKAAKKAAK